MRGEHRAGVRPAAAGLAGGPARPGLVYRHLERALDLVFAAMAAAMGLG